MARAALIIGCFMLLAVVMFGALNYTSAQLTEQLERECVMTGKLIGQERALRLLDEAIGKPKSAPKVKQSETGAQAKTGQMDDVSKAFGRAGAGVAPQVMINKYGEVFDAQMRLVLFRLGALATLLPGLMVFVFAAVVDGIVRRTVKAHEFSAHDPEIVALSMVGVVLVVFVMVALMAWPLALWPLILPSLVLVVAYLLNRATANYRY